MQNCKPQRQKLCQNPKAVGKQQHRCRLLRCLFVVSPGCADDKNESPGRIPTWKLLSNLKKEIPSLTHRSQRSTHKPLTWILNLVRQCPNFHHKISTRFFFQRFDCRELYTVNVLLVFPFAGPRGCRLHDQSFALLGTTPLQELRLRIDLDGERWTKKRRVHMQQLGTESEESHGIVEG